MSAFSTYFIGFVILIIALGAAAYLLHVPAVWIGVGSAALLGIAVVMATTHEKPRDPPAR